MEIHLYAEIASELEKKIRNEELSEHEKLPSERTLAINFGVSRSVIREALRVLDEKGMVEIIHGKGVFVKQPDKVDVIEKIEGLMETSNIKLDELLEARYMLETSVGKKLIKHITEQDMYKLKALYLKMDYALEDEALFTQLDTKFHFQLAEATKNQLLVLITMSLMELSNRTVYLETTDVSVRKHAQKEHGEMIRAIEEHDIERYEMAIENHLECIRKSKGLMKDNISSKNNMCILQQQ